MSYNIEILAFNSGLLSPKIDERIDVEKYPPGCRRLENMIPTKYGGAERRPGTVFIYDATDSPNSLTSSTVRLTPFIYSADVAYFIEIGNQYMRFFYDDAILEDESSNEVWIDADYDEDDLFELQFQQIGDVKWIVHPNYEQTELKRTDAYTFELDEIDFKYGPFLLRNDLIDPDNPSLNTLRCTAKKAGQYGSLISNAAVFLPGHVGALFKLYHPRNYDSAPRRMATLSGTTSSGTLSGKGTYDLVTRGTWTGTVVWETRDVGGDWEELFSWKSSADAYQNIVKSYVEDSNTRKHRLYSSDANAALRAELTINEPLKAGVVKVIGVGDSKNAVVEILSDLGSKSATRRWAEGAWSSVRGFPSCITFFEDRCIYAGAATGSADDSEQVKDYPNLLNLTY